MARRAISPKAPFDLRNQNSFFGGWPVLTDTDRTYALVMTFPLESSNESAAVVIRQEDNSLSAECYGATDEEAAIQQAYKLPEEPGQQEVLAIAEQWKPYRMWCEVLLHIWLRREHGLPKKDFRR